MTRQFFKGMGALLLAGTLALAGCAAEDGAAGPAGQDGQDGQDGQNGQNGQDGQDWTGAATVLKAQITQVTGASAVSGTVVTFSLKDQNGNAVTALPTGASISFTYAKLKDGQWKSYINRTSTAVTTDSEGNTITPALPSASQATAQTGTSGVVSLGGGNFSYTFTASGTTDEAVAFEASLTHRIGMQVSGSGLKPFNTTFDFVPAGGAVTATRNIATTAACLECHAGNFGFHGSSARIEVEYCVTCHNPGSVDPESGNSVAMVAMIHKIHAGAKLPSVKAGGSYVIYGHGGSKHDYSHVEYPQPLRNCTKCHTSSAATTDGDNWKTKPSRASCGSCHDDVDFAAGVGHAAMSSDASCALCHNADYVASKHATPIVTANNAGVPNGVTKFEYVLKSVTVGSDGRASFQFQVKKDGSPVTFDAYVDASSVPVAGFTGGPSFYVASSVAQDGIASPADFNAGSAGAIGTSAPSVSLVNVWNGKEGELSGPDAEGFYTAVIGGGTLPNVNAVLPAGAAMATGVIAGSFSQDGAEAALGVDLNGDGDKLDGNFLAKAVYKTAGGYAARRQIVSDAKCNACHEQLGFEPTFHGGARSDAGMCTICHNPVRNSSNWSSNYRDFVHAVHAAGGPDTDHGMRTNAFGWHASYEYWNVTYPGSLKNCEACHLPGTNDFSASAYTANGGALLNRLLPSTASSSNVTALTATSAPWLAIGNYSDVNVLDTDGVTVIGVDKSANLVVSPVTSSCLGCHDSTAAVSHMRANGGQVYVARGDYVAGAESCLVCHGPGRSAAIGASHQ
jgi:OmcA/MtrC family decaheme c-type cytochrome